MREPTPASTSSTGRRLPAVLAGAFLGVVVVVLVGVSVLVEGPAPQVSPPGTNIVTAVTPTRLSSVSALTDQ